jgi:hypothetical protein
MFSMRSSRFATPVMRVTVPAPTIKGQRPSQPLAPRIGVNSDFSWHYGPKEISQIILSRFV